MVSMWWICMTRVRWCGSMQSTNSNGPPSRSATSVGMRTSLATTASPPYFCRSASVSSEPICPTAPVTRIFFISNPPRLRAPPAASQSSRLPKAALHSRIHSGGHWAAPESDACDGACEPPPACSGFLGPPLREARVEHQVVGALEHACADERPAEGAALQQRAGEERRDGRGEAPRHVGDAGRRGALLA